MRPHRRQLTRLPCPWDSPGKNTGVGCHFLLQCMKVKSESESLSRARLLATPWTAAYQAPPSMDFPGKSTGVGCHCLLRQLLQSYPTLCNPTDLAFQASLSMGFSSQEYWSESPFSSPGDLADPGIEPVSLNISCIGMQVLYHEHHLGSHTVCYTKVILAVFWVELERILEANSQ